LTIQEHCGYELINDAQLHDLHHAKFTDNYGAFGETDTQLGTRRFVDAVEVKGLRPSQSADDLQKAAGYSSDDE